MGCQGQRQMSEQDAAAWLPFAHMDVHWDGEGADELPPADSSAISERDSAPATHARMRINHVEGLLSQMELLVRLSPS